MERVRELKHTKQKKTERRSHRRRSWVPNRKWEKDVQKEVNGGMEQVLIEGRIHRLVVVHL